MNFKFLKANNGDSILISFKDDESNNRNILIDGGMPQTYWSKSDNRYGELKKVIDGIRSKKEKIDLLVLTHIDEDHIGGILKWFEKDKYAASLVSKVWFNSGKTIAKHFDSKENPALKVSLQTFPDAKTSIKQAQDLELFIEKHNLWDKQLIFKGNKITLFGVQFEILSPTEKQLANLLSEYRTKAKDYFTSKKGSDFKTLLKDFIKEESSNTFKVSEDNRVGNGSSLAFLLTRNTQNYLFLGDAFPSTICESLSTKYSKANPLEVEFVKISHHGSSLNTSPALLSLLKTDNYIISTSGERHEHPHKRTIARILNSNPSANIYFNYSWLKKAIFLEQDCKDFPAFKCDVITDYPVENEH